MEVAAPGAGTDERGSPRWRALLWRLDEPIGLVALFALAFLVRILIAPRIGFYPDLATYRGWAERLADVGTQRFYDTDELSDYPPGYLYVLWVIGKLSSEPGYLLLKLPPIVCDLGLAWVTGTLAGRLAPQSLRQRIPVRTVVVAAVLFNPAVIALSAVWGQVDSVPALLAVSSLLVFFTGRRSFGRDLAGFLLLTAAVAVKPQTGFMLPVLLYALYRRHIDGRRGGQLVDGLLAVALIGAASLSVWILSALPFGLGPRSLVEFYRAAASIRPVTSANAFNFWGMFGFWRQDSTAPYQFGGGPLPVFGTHAAIFGTLVVLALIAFVIWQAHRAIGRGAHADRVMVVAAAASSLVAFSLLTRMSERYMFVALVSLAALTFVRQFRWVYIALSTVFLLNLWFAFSYFNSRTSAEDLHFNPIFDWLFGGFSLDTWQNKTYSAVVVGAALIVALRGVSWMEHVAPPVDVMPLASPRAARPASRSSPAPPTRLHALSRMTPLPSGRYARRAPHALVGLVCLFNFWMLRGELRSARYFNDSSFHLSMVRWAHDRISGGHIPLDGWFPYFALGSSFFHHYQSLPHTFTALLAYATGLSDATVYLWIVYLLVALWPISIYLSARLFGWSVWVGAAAAMVSPLIVSEPLYGYEQGSYTWQGWGLYSQLFAMWLLPLAWGLTWRAVAHGRSTVAAAVVLALTMACHFITGYLAVLTVGVWVLVLVRSSFLRRVGRAAIVTVASMLIASWVLVPLLVDAKWSTQTEFYIGSIYRDSYGAHKALRWLFDGRTFDDGRLPVVSLLVLTGAILCITRARRDPRARALLGAFALSMALFFGRPTWGRALELLPGFGDVQIHRFVMGVQLAGILLGGVGLAWIGRVAYGVAAQRLRREYLPALGLVVIAATIVYLIPAWKERIEYHNRGAASIKDQQAADAGDGRTVEQWADTIKANGDGRVYSGLRSNWGANYRVGPAHVYAYLADLDVDGIGFTFRTIPSLSNDPEALFDETNPADYQMFNVRYVIAPPSVKLTVPATLLASTPLHRFYRINTTGYWQVVDRAPAIPESRTTMWSSTAGFMKSDLASRNIYPGVAFGGKKGPPPTFTGAMPPPGKPGTVVQQTETLVDGKFSAVVRANRPAVALLKASYDPRWKATVDGVAVKPVMMAPSLVGVDVSPGTHRIELEYKPYGHYPLLLGIGLATILAMVLLPRWKRGRETLSRRLRIR